MTKIWGGSVINEWMYASCQIPLDVCLGEFLLFLEIIYVVFYENEILVA